MAAEVERSGSEAPARRLLAGGLVVTLLLVVAVLVVPVSTLLGGGPAAEAAPTWVSRTPLHVPRDDFADAVVDGEWWVLGGFTGARGNRLSSTEVYDPETGRWRFGPDLPEGVASVEGVAIGPLVYVFGGLDEDGAVSDFSAVLDTRSGTWRDLPPLPTPRYGHDVALVDGLIYLMAGSGPTGLLHRVDVFDPATGAWSTAAPLPTARDTPRAVEVGGRILVMGGWRGRGPTAVVEVYDTDTDTWQQRPDMPVALSRFATGIVGGRLVVTHHETTLFYDLGGGTGGRDRWTKGPPMPTSRHGHNAAILGGRYYVVGGCTENPLRDVAVNEVLLPAGADGPLGAAGGTTDGPGTRNLVWVLVAVGGVGVATAVVVAGVRRRSGSGP